MEKGKRLFSYLGSVFAFCMLALVVFLPGTKADAALAVEEINYENSTITIATSSNDTVLYFSDKNKKKWEMATDTFTDNKCTMDISWVSTTKDYQITFKGDQSSSKEEILSVTLPKQVSTFKAKYNQSKSEVTFTGAGTDRIIEYRKNNTNSWTTFGKAGDSQENLKVALGRLCENGASVYFRLQSQSGTSATSTGQRPSKEIACKINKKTTAPTVTIDTADSTIAVQSGWQVRKVDIQEKSNVQYVIGKTSVEKYSAQSDGNGWYTFLSAQDVPLTDLAPEAMSTGTNTTEDVYLQFRKAATSSSQISYITTVKIPAQEAAPTEYDAGISIEYTSSTSFKLTISAASLSKPYEYCVIDSDDLVGDTITDMESVTWKTVSTATATEIKETDAPNEGIIFFRKKAIGKTGDDDFKLASPYTKFMQIKYSDDIAGKINEDFYIFDGVCTTGNSAGHLQFSFATGFNSKITKIGLSQTPDPSAVGESSVTVSSSVTANGSSSSDSDKYRVTVTITNISLSDSLKTLLETKKDLTLYTYIEFETGDTVSSNASNGLRIHMRPKSSINTTLITSDPANKYTVTRFVGSTTVDGSSNYQYESFWFEVDLGTDYETSLGDYGTGNMDISSVQLGNYTLTKDSDYSYDGGEKKFTVNLSNFETAAALVPYYGTNQTLTIKLSSGEKLTDVTVKLVAPVALDDTYAWAFTAGKLVEKKTVTTTTSTGSTSSTEEVVNSYSVGYGKGSGSVNSVSVQSCSLKSVTLAGQNILAETTTNTVVFSNELLNTIGSTSGSNSYVNFVFEVTYSNGATQQYTINQGCSFTIM